MPLAPLRLPALYAARRLAPTEAPRLLHHSTSLTLHRPRPHPPTSTHPDPSLHSKSVTMVKGDKARVKSSDVVTREYTIHLHKRLQGM